MRTVCPVNSSAHKIEEIPDRRQKRRSSRYAYAALRSFPVFFPLCITVVVIRQPVSEPFVQQLVYSKIYSDSQQKISQNPKKYRLTGRMPPALSDYAVEKGDPANDRHQFRQPLVIPSKKFYCIFFNIFPFCIQFPTPPLHILVSSYRSQSFRGYGGCAP